MSEINQREDCQDASSTGFRQAAPRTCIFTIVAKNYLALALTLGDSLAKVHPGYDFFIVLADRIQGDLDPAQFGHKIIEVDKLGIDSWADMAFKYDISEFSTSIKPFCFEYFFGQREYENIMYFDPDIYIFKPLAKIEEALRDNFCVVTPHHSDLEVEWKGAIPEGNVLISGILNLGFIAFRDTSETRLALDWWKERLRWKCFLERMEGYFYDQNWVQFFLTSFDRGVFVLRDYGFNVAWWNLHERGVEMTPEGPVVSAKRLGSRSDCVFFHFSGFNALDPLVINGRYRKNPSFILEGQDHLRALFHAYAALVLANGHNALCTLKYGFSHYDNGHVVTRLHRRLYKEITFRDEGYKNLDSVRRSILTSIRQLDMRFEKPFSTVPGSFYALMQANGLVVKDAAFALDHLNLDRDSASFEGKIKFVCGLLKGLKTLIGVKRYSMFMKFLSLYSRDEYQLFLLGDLSRDTHNR